MSTSVNHPLFARLYTRLIAPSLAQAGWGRAEATAAVRPVGHRGRGRCRGRGQLRPLPGHGQPSRRRGTRTAPARARCRSRPTNGSCCATTSRTTSRWATERPTPWSSAWCCARSTTRRPPSPRRVGCCGPVASCVSSSTSRRPHRGSSAGCSGALDATIWPRLCGGCHLGRDTAGAIEQAGFLITEIDRFSFPDGARGPSSSLILGPRRTVLSRICPSETLVRARPLRWSTGSGTRRPRAATTSSTVSTPGSSPRVDHRQGPAHRRGQDPPPARSDHQGGQRHRGRLRRHVGRRAAGDDGRVQAAHRRRRGARLDHGRGVRHRARGGQARARPAPLRRADHGRCRPAPGQHRGDEDR